MPSISTRKYVLQTPLPIFLFFHLFLYLSHNHRYDHRFTSVYDGPINFDFSPVMVPMYLTLSINEHLLHKLNNKGIIAQNFNGQQTTPYFDLYVSSYKNN